MRVGITTLALVVLLGGATSARAHQELSTRKIAVTQRNVPRTHRPMVQAIEAALAPAFGSVIAPRDFKKVAKKPDFSFKAAILRKIAKRLDADYVVALSRKGASGQISIRVIGVASEDAPISWTTHLPANVEEQKRSGGEIGARALEIVSLMSGGPKESVASDEAEGAPSKSAVSEEPVASDDVRTKDPQAIAGARGPLLAAAGATIGSVGNGAGATVDEFTLAREELKESSTLVEAEVGAGPLINTEAFKVSLQGSARAESHAYFNNDPQSIGPNKVNSRRASFDLRAGALFDNPYINANARLLVRRDISDATRNRLEPEELTLKLNLEPFQLLAGRTTITWGRATLNSVVDIVDPIDTRDILIREKLPVWVGRGGLTLGPVRADVLFMPFFQADLADIPTGVGTDGSIQSPNRWITGNFPATSQQGVPVSYAFGRDNTTLRVGPQVGARLSSSIFGADIAASYLNQIDPFPSIRSAIKSNASQIDVSTNVDHYRRHVFAIDGDFTADRFHFIGEAMVALPSAPPVENNAGVLPYFAATAGFDYRSPRFFGNHEIRIFVEGTTTRAIVGQLPTDISDPTVAITRGRFPLPLAVLARAGYSFGPHVTIGALAVENLGQFVFPTPDRPKALDLYVRPELQLSLFHFVQLVAGVDILAGGRQQFFGSFRQNRRFTAALQVDY